MKHLKLHWQIIICMILGTFSGILFNKIGYQDSTIYTLILLLGDIFIRLLKMVIVPLVFTSIIIGVSSIKDQTKIGRLGLKTLVYYLSTSLIAILIGLMLANLIHSACKCLQSACKTMQNVCKCLRFVCKMLANACKKILAKLQVPRTQAVLRGKLSPIIS